MQNLKLIISNFIGFMVANPIFAYLLFGVILFFVIFAQISSCRSDKAKQSDANTKANIEQSKGKIEVLTDQKETQEQKTNEANKQLIEANSNFNRVIKRDSTQYNSNFSTVRQRYCLEFPNDSKCP